MKRVVLTTFVFFCVMMAFAAQKRIVVNSAEEFINAIGSNREIVIANEEGLLLTPAIESMAKTGKLKKYDYASRSVQNGVMVEQEFDGPMLVISGFKNLTIRGGFGSKRATVEVTPRYANVFTFINCENISLNDLYLGHTDEGYCTNGVVGFDGCKGISIENCGLFGCGTEGIELRKCSDFSMNESEIYKCSYHIMHVYGSSNCKFTNCVFYKNKEYEQVSVDSDCEDVVFQKCTFVDNTGTLFNFARQDNVKLIRCVISHDSILSNDEITCDEDCIWCLYQ